MTAAARLPPVSVSAGLRRTLQPSSPQQRFANLNLVRIDEFGNQSSTEIPPHA